MKPSTARAEDAGKVDQANPFNDPFTEELIEEYERLDGVCEKEMLDAMRSCKPHRQSQRDLLESAKERGMNKRALKAHLKERALKRKALAIREGLEQIDQDDLDKLKHFLGQLEMFGSETSAAAPNRALIGAG